MIKTRKKVVFPSSGKDFNRMVTCLLMLGLALTLRNGRMTLRILSALKFKSTAINSSILF
jgi:hypothetical protein